MPTKFIAIEGLDGCGKATQARLLSNKLNKNDFSTKIISFPRYAETSSVLVDMYLHGRIDKDPMKVNPYAASMCYSLDRYISFHRDWGQDIKEHTYDFVIFDRYTTSNITHQSIKIHPAQRSKFVKWVYDMEYIKFGMPEPNLELHLINTPESTITGLNERKEILDIHENEEYQKKVYETYQSIRNHLPGYCKNIFCSGVDGKLLPKETISINIYHLVKTLFN